MIEFDAFMAAIVSAREADSLPLLIAADYLDERGHHWAAGCRWAGDHAAYPLRFDRWGPAALRHCWCILRSGRVRLPWMVPEREYRRLRNCQREIHGPASLTSRRGRGVMYRGYRSREAAYAGLFDAFAPGPVPPADEAPVQDSSRSLVEFLQRAPEVSR